MKHLLLIWSWMTKISASNGLKFCLDLIGDDLHYVLVHQPSMCVCGCSTGGLGHWSADECSEGHSEGFSRALSGSVGAQRGSVGLNVAQ